MNTLKHLFENNRAWAEGISAEDPAFFDKLSQLQAPEYLWIGCSDSRVPANQITGLRRARCSCIATSPTWWCIPTSTACPSCSSPSTC
jgi:hypothetical protein